MIRLGHEEFFIEPLDQRRTGIAEEEDRREHIVYRSSAIIRKPPAVNQSADDFIRGEKTQTGHNDHWSNQLNVILQNHTDPN